MRLEFFTHNSTDAFVDEDYKLDSNGNSAIISEMLRAGIKAAQAGTRSEARHLLLRVTDAEQENESAWLWLASISEYPEELLVFLNNVLKINPENERAQEWSKATLSLLAKNFVQRGSEAAEQNRAEYAKQCFLQALVHDNQNEMAWLWLAKVTDSVEEKIAHLQKVLKINPENETARANLEALRQREEPQVREEEGFLDKGEVSGEAVEEDFPTEAVSEETVEEEQFSAETVAVNFEESEEYFIDADALTESDVQLEFDSEEAELKFLENLAQELSEKELTENFHDSGEFSIPRPEQDFSCEMPDSESLKTKTETLPNVEESEVFPSIQSAESDYDQPTAQNFAEESQPQPVEEVEETEELVSEESDNAEAEVIEAKTEHSGEENGSQAETEHFTCPFCREENEIQAFVCRTCRAMLTLSDLEMLLAHGEVNQEMLRQAVERMEVEDIKRGFEANELMFLGIGHLNLKNLRKGLTCLQKAAQLSPNNIMLGGQVNSLAIRLAEIEKQESVQSSMPKDRMILVVDDSPTVRKLISGKLEKSGHTVICAVDGMDAMSKLNDFVPDLILLDINMPRMDGYQVCKLIRGNETTKDVPVVMISGKDGFFDKVRGRMAGTTGYITKPFGPETLMKAIETYIVHNHELQKEEQ
ncbi:MAG TPA: response regulator [Pyrinomonadaceae bacterium]|nr:response regulator [Pyrinomonadaceae bacterium]